ncbi:MAG: hypothetical protein ACC634_05185, partial [Hyphomicrobiales bacterium]
PLRGGHAKPCDLKCQDNFIHQQKSSAPERLIRTTSVYASRAAAGSPVMARLGKYRFFYRTCSTSNDVAEM